jgi:hypothetical protein
VQAKSSLRITSHSDLNSLFSEDKNKFIGEFMAEDYKIIRGYLQGIIIFIIKGAGKQLRLYYTKFEPFQNKVASLCIIHGFGEYSGRFMNVMNYQNK